MGLNPKRLGTDEVEIAHLRTHRKALLLPVFMLLLDAVVLGVGIAAINRFVPAGYRTWADLALGLVCLVALVAFAVLPYLRWLTTTYTFTNRRIITQTGILNRRGHDLPLARINDVSYERSVTDRMLGCGTLMLQTAADDPVVLDDITDIERVHVMMTDLLFADPRAALADSPQHQRTPTQDDWRHDD